jgi:hypothetical protein
MWREQEAMDGLDVHGITINPDPLKCSLFGPPAYRFGWVLLLHHLRYLADRFLPAFNTFFVADQARERKPPSFLHQTQLVAVPRAPSPASINDASWGGAKQRSIYFNISSVEVP